MTRAALMAMAAAWLSLLSSAPGPPGAPWASGDVHAAEPQVQPSATSVPASPQRALLDQYCVGCHNQRLKSAGLMLDTMNVADVGPDAEAWEKVVRKLRARVMPPPGRPRPDERAYTAFVSHVETSLDRAAAGRPNPGRLDALRRLNRTEYQNAIRDVLGLEINVTSLLPEDISGDGFDNLSGGTLSATLLDRYLSAARKISRVAVGSAPPSPVADTIILPTDLTQDDHFDDLPFGTRGGALVHYTFPQDAEYDFQVRLGRNGDGYLAGFDEPQTHELELTVDGERVKVFTLTGGLARGERTANVDAGQDANLRVRLPVEAGPREVGVAFIKKSSALVDTGRQPFQRRFYTDDYEQRSQPVIYSVSIGGPFAAAGSGDTPTRRRLFVCRPTGTSDEAACAKRILSTLARRAYRRPVTDADLKRPLAFYDQGRSEGGFEEGIEQALRAVLMSPEFLFRVERDPEKAAPNTAYRITGLELASRLSFFLWSSVPDEELLDVASRGDLAKPAVLERQVRRMLADSRSSALVNNFAGQWLSLRNLPVMQPIQAAFPNFDEGLRRAFRRETELFFDSILREDRSVLDLIGANYTFLNERLARHYGVPNVYGSHFRRVTFGEEILRGGLLGQGSILALTAYPNRTSPVIRGNWILKNILGTPAPPPPANVPPLDESSATPRSMRERMEQHRANPACASCHALIDPLGFGLENFDAVGKWRARSEANTPIDASGILPDGTKFDGAAELRRALLSRPDLFLGTFTEKLLTYALGRGLEYYDAPAVRRIAQQAGRHEYRFSSIITAIVDSIPFQMRRSQS